MGDNKKKRKIPGWIRIAALLAVLLIIAGAYFGLKVYNEKQAEKENSSTEMLSVKTGDVLSFTYELDGAVYTFEREDSKSDWVYLQDPSLALEQDAVTDMLSTGTSVSTELIVADDLEKASEFGLDTPSFTLSMTLKDGSVKTVYVGSLNSMISDYYSYIEGDNRIFTLGQDFISSFTTAEELADASSSDALSAADASVSAY